MKVLVTGASGFLGRAFTPLLLNQGEEVYGLSRHPEGNTEGVKPLLGDVMLPDLGLREVPEKIDCVHHLAAVHRLGEDKDGSIWRTNVRGTQNVIAFCRKHKVPQLYFTSTAYTLGRNTYEQSKIICENLVGQSGIPFIGVFKPSIIMSTPDHAYPGHFSQFVGMLIRVHKRADTLRRIIEGTLKLPILEPVFRMKALGDGQLNLVLITDVARGMADFHDRFRESKVGCVLDVWLTNGQPPTLAELVKWTGEYIKVSIRLELDFDPTPIEALAVKMGRAFVPYMWGDHFPSRIEETTPITREFIHETIKRLILEGDG